MIKTVITDEMFADWREHPVTQALTEVLAKRRRHLKDTWEEGNATDFASEAHGLLNAAAIGQCQGYKFVQELELDQLKGEIESDE